MFKVGMKNDIGISYKWYGFGVERSRLGLWLTAIQRGFELCECLLVVDGGDGGD